jgi:hypothetical protein
VLFINVNITNYNKIKNILDMDNQITKKDKYYISDNVYIYDLIIKLIK